MRFARTLLPLLAPFALLNCGDSNGFEPPPPPPPPTVGSIQVSIVTTGADLDANGYVARLPDGTVLSIGINGTATFNGLSPGSHRVELADLAGNCMIMGDNPETVTVTAGATTTCPFQVMCFFHLNPAQVAGLSIQGTLIAPTSISGILGSNDHFRTDPQGQPAYLETWRVRVVSGGSYTLETVGATFDTTLELLEVRRSGGSDFSLTPIRFDDDGGGGLHSRIDATLHANTEYWVWVGGFNQSALGSYTLRIN